MKVEQFLKVVEEKAIKVERAEKSPLQGWGLNPPEDDWFEEVQLGDAYGCTKETCTHASHSPAAPDYAWVPRFDDMKIIRIGRACGADYYSDYFAVIRGDEVRVYELWVPKYYHVRIHKLDDLSELPDYLCRNLKQLIEAQQ